MVQQVNVNGEIHKFPDEATPDMIQKSLSQYLSRQKMIDFSTNGILNRPAKRLGEDALSLIKNVGNTISQGIPSTLNELINEPKTAGKNIAAGVAGIPINIANTVMNIPAYLAHLESNRLSNEINKYTPQIPKEKIQNYIAGEPNQHDIDVRKLTELLPFGIPAGKTTFPLVKAGTNKIIGKTDPLLQAHQLQLELMGKNKEADVEKAIEAYKQNQAAHLEAIAQSKREIGKSDADLLEHNLMNRQQNIQDLTGEIENLKQQLVETKPQEGALPETQNKLNAAQEAQQQAEQDIAAQDAAHKAVIEQSQRETGKSNPDLMQYNADKRQKNIQDQSNEAANLQQQLATTKPEETALPQAEENLARSQQSQENAQNLMQNVQSNINQHLNEGAAHHVRAASAIRPRIKSIINYWKDSFKNFHNDIKDANFEMPKEAMDKLDYSTMSPIQLIQTFGNDAYVALKNRKIDEFVKNKTAKEKGNENNSYFDNLMEVAPTSADTNAADFLTKFRDFRGRTYKLSQQLLNPKIEYGEKQKIQSALDKARPMQDQMKEVLNTGLGKYQPEFERLNNGYSQQVFPLGDNPFIKKAKKGTLRGNMMETLSSNESGMPLVRELVKQDPEILRNIIGDRYFKKPNEIYNPNEMTLEYLHEMPQLQQMLGEHQQASKTLEQANNNVELAKQQHVEIKGRHEEAQELETKVGDLHEKIKNDQEELANVEKHISQLRETAKNKNISLQKKMSIEKEISDLKDQHADLQKRHINAEKIENQINDLTEKIKEHQDKIPKIEANIARLRETDQQENISLEKKMKTKNELKKLRKELAETNSKLLDSTTGLRKAWLVAKKIYKVGKKFT